jgi:hypothetical protein
MYLCNAKKTAKSYTIPAYKLGDPLCPFCLKSMLRSDLFEDHVVVNLNEGSNKMVGASPIDIKKSKVMLDIMIIKDTTLATVGSIIDKEIRLTGECPSLQYVVYTILSGEENANYKP